MCAIKTTHRGPWLTGPRPAGPGGQDAERAGQGLGRAGAAGLGDQQPQARRGSDHGAVDLAVRDRDPREGGASVDVQVEFARCPAAEGVLDLPGDGRGRDDADGQVVRGRRVERAEDQGDEEGREAGVGQDEAGVEPEPGLIPARVICSPAHCGEPPSLPTAVGFNLGRISADVNTSWQTLVVIPGDGPVG